MGVFDFTDLQSVTSLAQFVLRLRTHYQDVKDATSIEAVNSVPSLCWRSDLPDFENQIGEQFDGRVASWTHGPPGTRADKFSIRGLILSGKSEP